MKMNTVSRGGLVFATQNANLTTAATFQTKPNSSYALRARGVYNRPGANQAAFYQRMALFRTDAAGVLTQVGATITIGTDLEDTAGAQFLISPLGTTIIIQVAAEGTPTNWNINHELDSADDLAQA